jgi:2-keto-3-deoxy-L-rhamnonate aldolase RhmA
MFEAVTTFRERLRQGQLLIGAGICLTDPQASEALADSVDFFWLDLEHSTMSPEALRGHLLVARSKNKLGIVRVPGGDTPFIKPVLDAGAQAVVVPQVRTPEEVRQIVADCRYPPVGRRGFGPLIPTNYGRDSIPEYVERANTQLLVAVMIETTEAVQAIDEIVSIPGLDAVVLGPWDLSGSFGVLGELEHPSVVAAMEEVIAKARAAGLSVGSGMGVDPEYAQIQAARGVQWLQIGGDCGYLVRCMDQITTTVRNQD